MKYILEEKEIEEAILLWCKGNNVTPDTDMEFWWVLIGKDDEDPQIQITIKS